MLAEVGPVLITSTLLSHYDIFTNPNPNPNTTVDSKRIIYIKKIYAILGAARHSTKKFGDSTCPMTQ